MLTIMKLIRGKVMGIFFWTVVLFSATLTSGMVADANAIIKHLSRACGVFGINESLTWNRPSRQLKGSYKVVSDHYKSDTISGEYIWQHWVATGFSAPTDGVALAQHTGEFWAWAKVVGGHWRKSALTGRVRKIKTTVATTCGVVNW